MKLKLKKEGLTGETLKAAESLQAILDTLPDIATKEEIAAEIKTALPGLFKEDGSGIDLKQLLDALDEKNENSLKAILLKQGNEITNINNKLNAGVPGQKKNLIQILTEKKEKLQEIKRKQAGTEVIRMKSIVTSISGSASVPSIPADPYFPMPTDTGEFVDIALPKLFILDIIDKGDTSSPSLLWTEQAATVFGAAVVSEGGLKPWTTKSAVRRVSQYSKIAAIMTITEELENDIPKLATNFKRLFTDEVMRVQHNTILANIIAICPGYVNTSMNGQILAPDNYGAIAAAVAQIQNLNFEPDFLAINPIDFWIMNQVKDSVGQYNIPPFVTVDMGEMKFAQLRLIVNPAIAVGSFLVGDAKTYKVDIYEDYTLRIGYVNDDFARNQYSAVGEVKFHSYIAQNRINAWCYAQFAVVKAAIAQAPAA